MPESICEIVRRAEQNYIHGNAQLGSYVDYSMHDTIERIYAYLNSKHISGEKDSLGREKPFFNIVTAAVNVWYRATDIDRKDIRFVATNDATVPLALVANVILQNWMNKTRFGQFLNKWGRTLAQYGSAVVKFLDHDGELTATVVPWQRLIPDPIDFDALPKIEKFFKTPAQLTNMATPGHPDYAGYDLQAVQQLINAVGSRKTSEGQQIDNLAEFIPIYEVHGLLDARLLQSNPDLSAAPRYSQQMHTVSFVAGEGKDEYKDFTLFKGSEKRDPYLLTHLIEEEGRILAQGAVEYLFDSQWMQNHAIKAWKDNLDLASKLIMQTADTQFVGRNIFSAIETGDILIHKPDMPLTKVPNDEYDLSNIKAFQDQWQMMGQSISSTPDSLTGKTLPANTPYSLAAYQGAQANSLFEIMTENKGMHVEDMIRLFVVDNIKRTLKNKDQIVAIFNDAGVQEIDALYVPSQAIKRYNDRTIDQMFAAIDDPNAPVPTPFDQETEQNAVRQDMSAMGNTRIFKPDQLDEKQWNEIFSDFNWDNVRIEVTNENVEKQAVLQTLASLYTATAATDPVAANIILAKVLNETGVMSPLQVSSLASRPVPSPAPASTGAPLQDLAKTTNV